MKARRPTRSTRRDFFFNKTPLISMKCYLLIFVFPGICEKLYIHYKNKIMMSESLGTCRSMNTQGKINALKTFGISWCYRSCSKFKKMMGNVGRRMAVPSGDGLLLAPERLFKEMHLQREHMTSASTFAKCDL